MELTARLVIVPLSLVSLLSGLVQSLGTKWGLFHHYWVLVKFLLTLLATIVLILQLKPISYISDIASNTTLTSDNLLEARLSLVVHAGGGLLVLLAVTILSVYKPRGMTRYGWHKRNEQS
ncbi:hypothetical protein [Metabacillus sediminilitoris]|nr:hypothetical protein [Metabacillus sediminilitoris]